MTPEAIKEEFTAAQTVAEVDALARKHMETVKAMSADPALAVHAIHIKNLAKFRRMCITNGWGQ